jgi:hypothetical protein
MWTVTQLTNTPVKAGTWVQTERKSHEAFAALIGSKPKAAQLMHLLVARMGDHNAVVVSQKVLAQLMKCHVNTVGTAIRDLAAGRWIEVRQIGERGTVNAYIVNDRVAWSGPRDGIRHSLFSAAVVISEEEQPDRHELGQQPPLRKLPRMFPRERQLPSGDGLPPPSQPSLPDMEPDLPSLSQTEGEQTDIEDWMAPRKEK